MLITWIPSRYGRLYSLPFFILNGSMSNMMGAGLILQFREKIPDILDVDITRLPNCVLVLFIGIAIGTSRVFEWTFQQPRP